MKRFIVYYNNLEVFQSSSYDAAVRKILNNKHPRLSNIKSFHIYDSKFGLVWSL